MTMIAEKAVCGECVWIDPADSECDNLNSPESGNVRAPDADACERFARKGGKALRLKGGAGAQIAAGVREMQTQVAAMAEMLRITNERMAAMEQTIRTLEKVTPWQASRINKMIRERAAEICADWRMEGQEKPAAAAIRRAVRESTGARTAREISRCDYEAVCDMIAGWEDYDTIQRIRKGAKQG